MKYVQLAVIAGLILGAGDIDDGYFGRNGQAQWDAPLTNADGTPCTDLGGFVIAAFRPTEDPRVVTTASPVWSFRIEGPANLNFPMSSVCDGLKAAGQAEGSRWLLLVKAFDLAGNESGWSNSWTATMDTIPPGQAKNFILRSTK